MPQMPETPRQLLRNYLQTLFNFAGSRVSKAAGLLFISGLFQGISLLMLIPLLSISGLSNTGNSKPTALQSFMDTLGLSNSLPAILGLFLIIVILEAIFTRYRSITLNALNLDFTHHLRNQLYQQIGSASWQFHSRNHSSDAMHLLDNAVNKVGAGTYYTLQLFVLLTQAVVFLFVASSLSLPMTLIMMITGVVLYILIRPINKKVFKHGERAVRTNQTLYRNMVDFFSGLKLAKSYNRSDRHIEEFRQTGQQLLKDEKAVVQTSAFAQMWLRILSASLLCVFVYVALTVMHMGIERLLVLIVVVNRLYATFSSGQRHWQALLQALPSFAIYQQSIQKFQQHQETQPNPKSTLLPLRSELRLENVSFAYSEDKAQAVLHNFNANFPANTTIAISGESGSGKSTLADIIMGLLIPDQGTLYIDDQPLASDQLFNWRKQISYVPQEVYLFAGSIRDNLQWISDQPFDGDQIWAALDAAAAGDFIRRLPEQLDTLVGERGVQLSGGERQRIALARALLRKPNLLILDEATSALDQKNETRIRDALKQLHGNMTIIIIAHRESTVAGADHVVKLTGNQL